MRIWQSIRPSRRADVEVFAHRGWLWAGLLCVGLSVASITEPLMPTTIFVMMAAACFACSSRRLEAVLLAHPRFGQALGVWRSERAISRWGKLAGCSAIAAGYAIYVWIAQPAVVVAFALGGTMLACAAWTASRPLPRR